MSVEFLKVYFILFSVYITVEQVELSKTQNSIFI